MPGPSLDTITVDLPRHGRFVATSLAVDRMISRYLPSSPLKLRAKVEERTGLDYADVADVSTLLVILASFEGGRS